MSPWARTAPWDEPPRRIRARSRASRTGIGERLGQEVVGAGVEGFGLIELTLLGGEHQDRGANALIAEGGGDGVAVELGQHQVQDDGVVVLRRGPGQTVLAVEGDVDGVALGAQSSGQRPGHGDLVLDDEDPH